MENKKLYSSNGVEISPISNSSSVIFDNGKNLNERIEEIGNTTNGGYNTNIGVEPKNIFDENDVIQNKGIGYGLKGAITENSQYSCVFIPLEYDEYYYINYPFVENGGTSGANAIVLAKGNKDNFTGITIDDIAEDSDWLENYNKIFRTEAILYREFCPTIMRLKTPKLTDLKNSQSGIGIVLNYRFSSKPISYEIKVFKTMFPIIYQGTIIGKNMAFFGDSITNGTDGGYVPLIMEKLKLNEGFNYGSSGSDTRRLLNIAMMSNNGRFIDYRYIQAVTIMIGTNGGVSGNIANDIPDICISDIGSYPFSYSAEGKTITSAVVNEPEDFFLNCFPNTFYGNIAATIEYMLWQKPKLKVYLITIPPSNRGNHIAVRNAIIELGAKLGIEVIDAQANAGLGFYNLTETTLDKTHLNAKGNEMWASYIANYIEKSYYEND